MSGAKLERVSVTIADILTRIVLTQPDPDEEVTDDADDRVRPSVDRRPG